MTAEDVAGNPMPSFATDFPVLQPTDQLQIFIDTQGPQVTAITPNNSNFNLFALKPAQIGPTPAVNSLTIAFKDLPSRADSADANNKFLYDALVSGIAQTAGNYVLVGDHVGTIAIQSITVTNSSTNQITGVTLTGAQTTTTLTAAGLVGATTQPEVGDYILVTTGAAAGQVRRITAFNAATGAMTLDIALLNTPAAGDLITITKAATRPSHSPSPRRSPTIATRSPIKDNLVDPGQQQARWRVAPDRAARSALPHRRRRPRRQLRRPLHRRLPSGDRQLRLSANQHRHQRRLRLGSVQRPDRRRRHRRRPQLHAAGTKRCRRHRAWRLQRPRPAFRRQIPAGHRDQRCRLEHALRSARRVR